jgi:hypothetical protein
MEITAIDSCLMVPESLVGLVVQIQIEPTNSAIMSTDYYVVAQRVDSHA